MLQRFTGAAGFNKNGYQNENLKKLQLLLHCFILLYDKTEQVHLRDNYHRIYHANGKCFFPFKLFFKKNFFLFIYLFS